MRREHPDPGPNQGPPVSPPEEERTFVLHPPRQERSRKTLDHIAAAALELMADAGPEGVTVADIVERAGASVGSFYARFGGKEDLIRYLQDRVWSEATNRWDDALAQEDWGVLPVRAVVEGVVGLLFRTLAADFRQRRVLGGRNAQDPEGGKRAAAFHQHVLAAVTPLVLERTEEITHPKPEVAVDVGYRLVLGGVREMLESEGDSEVLVKELARAWTAYLTADLGEGAGALEGEVDFFDPWR